MIPHRSNGASVRRHLGRLALGLSIWATVGASSARAGISFVDMFRSNTYTQTGNGNSLTFNGSFFAAHLFSTNSNDFSTAQLTYPGPGSPVALTQQNPTTFVFQTALLPTQASMDGAFPIGTYTFNANGLGGPGSTSFSYTSDSYPQSLPFLSGTTYSALQGLNASSAFTFQFSPFLPAPSVNSSFLFLTIFDTTSGLLAFDAGFQPSTTTSLNLAANTLLPGHIYTYEVIFSDRVLVASPGAAFSAQLGFDLRTTGSFFTAAAVPEPASLALVAQAAVFSAWFVRRRRSGRSIPPASV